MKFRILTLFIVLSGFLTAGSAFCQVILTVRADDWENAVWGSPASQPTSGNDYVVDGSNSADLVRANETGTTPNFSGDSLSLINNGIALFGGNGSTEWTIDSGGALIHGSSGSTFDIGGTITVGSGGGRIDLTNGVFDVSASMSGSGTLVMDARGSDFAPRVSFTGGGTYSGTFDWTTISELSTIEAGGVDFVSYSNATQLFDLSVTPQALYNLNSADSFSGFQVNTGGGLVSLAPGTYTYSDLQSEGIGGLFTDNGGSVTIIPEPSAGLLVMGALGLGLLLRRRRI